MTSLTYAHLMGLPKTLATKAKTIQPKAQKLAERVRAAMPKRAAKQAAPAKSFVALIDGPTVEGRIAQAVDAAVRAERERFGAAVRMAAASATTRDDLITASAAAAAGSDPKAILESLAKMRAAAAAAAAPSQTRSFNRT